MTAAFNPFFADTLAWAETMNRFCLISAFGLALAAIFAALCSRRFRFLGWLSVVCVAGSAKLMFDLFRWNSPLPWHPLIILSPSVLCALALAGAWRASHRRMHEH